MGNINWNNPNSRKREPETRKRKGLKVNKAFLPKALWAITILAALLFFLSSFGNSFSNIFLKNAPISLLQGLAILFAIIMVGLAVRDKNERDIKNQERKQLLNILQKQKKVLRTHFDLREKLSAKSSLNFAACLEETLKNEKENLANKGYNEPSFDSQNRLIPELSASLTKNDIPSEINLAKKLIEGEDISPFPPEWQDLFVINEGKEPVAKLNEILKIKK